MQKEADVGRSRSWSRSWGRSRFFQAGAVVGVGVAEIWLTPQPCLPRPIERRLLLFATFLVFEFSGGGGGGRGRLFALPGRAKVAQTPGRPGAG